MSTQHRHHPRHAPRQNQFGLTLVELMVALALSSVIAVAAVSALVVARQGFNSVDAASQLRDNGRFASDLIQRLAVQSGFLDITYSAATRVNEFSTASAASNPAPNVLGADSALVTSVTNLPSILTSGSPGALTLRSSATSSQSGCTSATDTACANSSDVLVMRYQSSEGILGSGDADGAMINCAGVAETVAPIDKEDRIVSVLHVARSSGGEPSLMCSYSGASGWLTQPVVEGVESFQVLYGVDGFTTVNTKFTGPEDSVPDKYLNASQMVVGTGTTAAESADTYSNWRRVRSLRIGLVLRGSANSALVRTANIARLCPLGIDPSATATEIANGTAACIDASGSQFPPTGLTVPDDGRLRQILTFTVFLRNVQTQ